MSVTEAHTIGELLDFGPLPQRALGGRLRLEKSTVSRLVDELSTRGIVQRVPNPDDGRSVLVQLTTKGRRRAERLQAARLDLFASLLAELDPDDRRAVAQGLAALGKAARAIS